MVFSLSFALMMLFWHMGADSVWHRKGEAFNHKNTPPIIKQGGGSIVLLGCFAGTDTENLVLVQMIMSIALKSEALLGRKLLKNTKRGPCVISCIYFPK